MPPRRGKPDSSQASDWMRRARNYLNRARGSASLPSADMEMRAADTQQAAEFALKAIHNFIGRTYPHTHDIRSLAEDLERAGIEIPEQVKQAVSLTDFYFRRYPSASPPVTQAELDEAMDLAEGVVAWAESIIRGGLGVAP